ncbi:hypothetical protein Q0F98_36935 [Paenibacillus amylolyticus]|nr:hypothetical protein Q0F98_36935 [Paenibacillus amylolyticus]
MVNGYANGSFGPDKNTKPIRDGHHDRTCRRNPY